MLKDTRVARALATFVLALGVVLMSWVSNEDFVVVVRDTTVDILFGKIEGPGKITCPKQA